MRFPKVTCFTPRTFMFAATSALLFPAGLFIAAPQGDVQDDPFLAVRGLVGTWVGESHTVSATWRTTCTYEWVLNNKFLYSRERSEVILEDGTVGQVAEAWSILSYDPEAKRIVLREFHEDGSVFTYRVEQGEEERLMATSIALEGYRFAERARRTLTLVSADVLHDDLELAKPGEDWFGVTWTRYRRKR